MAQVTLGGAQVVSGQLVVPETGVWTADLVVDASALLPSSSVLAADSGASWTGSIAVQGLYDGRLHVRLVGGGGGLPRVPSPKTFRAVSLRTLLRDTLGAVGESLSAASDASLLSTTVAAYARLGASAVHVVSYWASKAGLSWRVLPDGTVWIGAAQTASTPTGLVLLRDHPTRRSMTVGIETMDLLPGHVVFSKTVDSLLYSFDEDAARCEVFYQ